MAKSVILSLADMVDWPNWKIKVSAPGPPVRISAPLAPLI